MSFEDKYQQEKVGMKQSYNYLEVGVTITENFKKLKKFQPNLLAIILYSHRKVYK